MQNLGTLAPYTYWYDHPPIGWLQVGGLHLAARPGGRRGRLGAAVRAARDRRATRAPRRPGLRAGPPAGLPRAGPSRDEACGRWTRCRCTRAGRCCSTTSRCPGSSGRSCSRSTTRHLGKHMLAGLIFGIAVLTKETNLIFAPALLLAIWQSAYRPTGAFGVVGGSAIMTATGAMYVAYAALRGELLPGADHVSVAPPWRSSSLSRARVRVHARPGRRRRGGLRADRLAWPRTPTCCSVGRRGWVWRCRPAAAPRPRWRCSSPWRWPSAPTATCPADVHHRGAAVRRAGRRRPGGRRLDLAAGQRHRAARPYRRSPRSPLLVATTAVPDWRHRYTVAATDEGTRGLGAVEDVAGRSPGTRPSSSTTPTGTTSSPPGGTART